MIKNEKEQSEALKVIAISSLFSTIGSAAIFFAAQWF